MRAAETGDGADRPAEIERIAEGEAERRARIAGGIRALREGHGANCSSIGSVVDTLFAGAILGGAIFAAVAAALARDENVRVVGGGARVEKPGDAEPAAGEDERTR